MTHDDAIFIEEWDDVSDSSKSRERSGLQKKITQCGRNLFRLAGMLAKGPGKFECDSCTTQTMERIVVTRQSRMHDRYSVWKLFRHAMVVGNDQID